MGRSLLVDRLRTALPKGSRFTTHHLSSPPTKCSAIFAAPPGQKDEETYCENQFLSASIEHENNQVHAFAIEVLVYTTEHLTTLFVSKADSTGYIQLLNLPPGAPSSVRIISQTFLEFLIEERTRSDRRLVLSLFARAQNQYLFPGSVENRQKHVLDDRGLIKWWCRVVNPILANLEAHRTPQSDPETATCHHVTEQCQGFLRVPGCDFSETRIFFPKDSQSASSREQRWTVADPLQSLGRSPDLPERCLIPRFPDDPKARFVQTLDDELPDEDTGGSQSQQLDNETRKTTNTGRWRSVKSLDQFWEMMSFRQECSSGRLVGFLWAVFTPSNFRRSEHLSREDDIANSTSSTSLPTPHDSQRNETDRLSHASHLPSSPAPEPPSTPPSLPQPSQEPLTPSPMKALESRAMQMQPEETRHFYWPRSSRGEVVLRPKDYERVGRLLLRQDYANEEVATESTRKWVNGVAERADIKTWGFVVVGEVALPTEVQASSNGASGPAVLNAGLIRKKKRLLDSSSGQNSLSNGESTVTSLSAGFVRKKAKTSTEDSAGAVSKPDLMAQEKPET